MCAEIDYYVSIYILPMMTTIVNQAAILRHLVTDTWTIPFETDRVVTPLPVAVTTTVCCGFGTHY